MATELITLRFFYKGLEQPVSVHRGATAQAAIAFALRVLGVDESRAQGALCLNADGVPVLLDTTLAADGLRLYLQLGPEPAHGGASGGAGTTVTSTSPDPKHDPKAENSRCWTWDAGAAALPSHAETVKLTKRNLVYGLREGEYSWGSCPTEGSFAMPIVPSSCAFTSGVHEVTLQWNMSEISYAGCGVISQVTHTKIGELDAGVGFEKFPYMSFSKGGLIRYILDCDARTLTTVAEGKRTVKKVPAGPLFFAASIKGTHSGLKVEIIHDVEPVVAS